jgi:hypothetical protein
MAKRIFYKATFRGIRKTAKSPIYHEKDACLRWIVTNAHRVRGELAVYEIDITKIQQQNDSVAVAYEYPNMRLDREQMVSVEMLKDSETFLFDVGRLSLWGVLNTVEDARFGLITYA